MKITYKENPLDTVVELDEHEKKELWYKIRCEELMDLLFEAHFHLKEGKYYDLDRVKQAVEPDYYYGTEDNTPSDLDKRCDSMLECYVSELKANHIGDCTCFPASCIKCHAEDKLGIDTIKGLGKHSAYKIESAIRKYGGIDGALEYLKDYNPEIDESWKNNPEGFYEHLPRWKKEAKVAYDWLLKYKEEHGPWT